MAPTAAAPAAAQLHRCRFFQYAPTAANALSFSPDGEWLAVARANADIELWSVAHDWILDRRIAGTEHGSVEAIVWAGDGRLFSAGHHALITEWDTLRLQPKTSTDSYGGAVWGIAVNCDSTLLAAGCEDGTVRLFDVSDGGLRYLRSLDGQRGRILSVCWANNGQILASGSSEGTIRLWNLQNARTLRRFSVPSGDINAPALIWTLALLADGTLVSGDSLGHVTFWDTATGTVVQTIMSHSADVLTLAVTQDGLNIYASGADNKVVQLRALNKANTTSSVRWVVTCAKRVHTHDVRALALSPLIDQHLLVSGGVDTTLVTYDTADFKKTQTRTIYPFPLQPMATLARQRRVICLMYTRQIELWTLGKAAPVDTTALQTNHSALPLEEGHGKAAELRLKGGRNLVCCAMSNDGHWLAVSDNFILKLFHVDYSENQQMHFRLVNNLPTFDSELCAKPALVMTFTPDSTKLLAAHLDMSISVLTLSVVDGEVLVQLARSLTHHQDVPYDQRSPVTMLTVSADGQWLATADGANRIFVYNMDTLRLHTAVPVLDSRHTALGFHDESSQLVIACADSHVHAFHVERKQMSEITRDENNRLVHLLRRRKEKICGILSNPSRPGTIIVWGLGFMCELKLPKDNVVTMLPPTSKPPTKGKKTASQLTAPPIIDDELEMQVAKEPEVVAHDRGHASQSGSIKLQHTVQPCLFLDLLDGNEFVAVQRPWMAVMESFPPKLHRSRYGS